MQVTGMIEFEKCKCLVQKELPEISKVVNLCLNRAKAPCHVSKKMLEFFTESDVTVLLWPGNSPDLNPIYDLWSIIKSQLGTSDCSTKLNSIMAFKTSGLLIKISSA